MKEAAMVTLVIGIIWALLLILPVLHIIYVEGGFQTKMAPTAILCAPFALCGAGYWAVSMQYPAGDMDGWEWCFHLCYFGTILFYLVVLSQMPTMVMEGGVFAPPLAAALTFPFTIVATSLVRAHTSREEPALGRDFSQLFAIFAAVASVLVVWTVAVRYAIKYALGMGEEPKADVMVDVGAAGEGKGAGSCQEEKTGDVSSVVHVEVAMAEAVESAPSGSGPEEEEASPEGETREKDAGSMRGLGESGEGKACDAG